MNFPSETEFFDKLLEQALSNLEMLLKKTHDPMHNNMLRDSRETLQRAILTFRRHNWPGE